jgi:hypothetical protein
MITFFLTMFKIIEAIPKIRDGFYFALDQYLQMRVNRAEEKRSVGYEDLKNATNKEQALKALGVIVRNRPY